jgi:hypothetical protein
MSKVAELAIAKGRRAARRARDQRLRTRLCRSPPEAPATAVLRHSNHPLRQTQTTRASAACASATDSTIATTSMSRSSPLAIGHAPFKAKSPPTTARRGRRDVHDVGGGDPPERAPHDADQPGAPSDATRISRSGPSSVALWTALAVFDCAPGAGAALLDQTARRSGRLRGLRGVGETDPKRT